MVTAIDVGIRKMGIVTRHRTTNEVIFHASINMLVEAFLHACQEDTPESVKKQFSSFRKALVKAVRETRKKIPEEENPTNTIMKALASMKYTVLSSAERLQLLCALKEKYASSFFHGLAFIVIESQMEQPFRSFQDILCTLFVNRCVLLTAISAKTFFGCGRTKGLSRAQEELRKTGREVTSSVLYRIRKHMMVEKAVIGFGELWLIGHYGKDTITDVAEASLFARMVVSSQELVQTSMTEFFTPNEERKRKRMVGEEEEEISIKPKKRKRTGSHDRPITLDG